SAPPALAPPLDTVPVVSWLPPLKDNSLHFSRGGSLTGMRRSELCGLRWGNVDVLGATLSVVEALHIVKGGMTITEPPKSKRGKRNIALGPQAALLLQKHRESEAARATFMGRILTDHDYVFARPDGRPLSPDTFTHAFKGICDRLGIKAHLHMSRHTHASLMLKAGVHPKVVSERLGHSNIGITLDTYSHVTPGLQAAAAERLDDIIGGNPSAENKDDLVSKSVSK
ncbi:MAG: site-specific integrase, partial [Chloroflexi bacterium]|nr:site-specific integrase [Chloroflexota bacterium]